MAAEGGNGWPRERRSELASAPRLRSRSPRLTLGLNHGCIASPAEASYENAAFIAYKRAGNKKMGGSGQLGRVDGDWTRTGELGHSPRSTGCPEPSNVDADPVADGAEQIEGRTQTERLQSNGSWQV